MATAATSTSALHTTHPAFRGNSRKTVSAASTPAAMAYCLRAHQHRVTAAADSITLGMLVLPPFENRECQDIDEQDEYEQHNAGRNQRFAVQAGAA